MTKPSAYELTPADKRRLNAILGVWEQRLRGHFAPQRIPMAMVEMRIHALAFIVGRGGFPPNVEEMLSPTLTPEARAVLLEDREPKS